MAIGPWARSAPNKPTPTPWSGPLQPSPVAVAVQFAWLGDGVREKRGSDCVVVVVTRAAVDVVTGGRVVVVVGGVAVVVDVGTTSVVVVVEVAPPPAPTTSGRLFRPTCAVTTTMPAATINIANNENQGARRF